MEVILMIKVTLAFSLMFVVVLPANAADVSMKTFTTISKKGDMNLNEAFFVTAPVNGSLGFFAWGIGNHSWAETELGITYSPTTWSQFLLGAGVEQNTHPLRGYAGLWLGNKDVSLLTEVELGGSGWWYDSIGTAKINECLSVGFTARRFEGIGPRIEVSIPKMPFTLWGTPYIVEPEKKEFFPGTILGVTTKF